MGTGMVRARSQEIDQHREDTSARGALFDCGFCVRTTDKSYTGPTVDEGGNKLEPWDVLERYNQRRYAHLDRDFHDARALREHLVDRAHYWFREDAAPGDLASALSGIDATVAMMEQRRVLRAADTKAAADA